jgi:hypothetical protein
MVTTYFTTLPFLWSSIAILNKKQHSSLGVVFQHLIILMCTATTLGVNPNKGQSKYKNHLINNKIETNNTI